MPQFDPTIFASQVFWLAIAFAALYFLMTRLVLPRLQDTVEQRVDRIAADLDRAEALKREAEELHRSYEAALQDARDQAKAAINLAVTEMAQESARREAALSAELEGRVAAAEQRIVEARNEARTHVRDIAIETCQAASERLIEAAVDPTAVAAAIDAEMAARNLTAGDPR